MLPIFFMLTNLATDRVRASKDRGATAVEYGLMVALIAAVIIVVVTALGLDVRGAFDTIENGIGGSQG